MANPALYPENGPGRLFLERQRYDFCTDFSVPSEEDKRAAEQARANELAREIVLLVDPEAAVIVEPHDENIGD